MRLTVHNTAAGPRLGVAVGDGLAVEVADLGSGLPATMTALIDGGPEALSLIRRALDWASARAPKHRLEDLVLAAPVGRVGKVVAIGRNYREHASEEGVEAPSSPVAFAKFPSSIVGPEADVRWRASDSSQVDWEAELAVVIGRHARDVSAYSALDHVLGYTCLNDVSARDLQFGDGQWTRGKSLDTFCPIGPWLVTADEIPDPQRLRVRLFLNGECMQDASTEQMVHGVAEIIAFCSRTMSLEPGDVIATGTPGGVGVFRTPPRFLADGDEVVVDIDRVGRLRNHCRIEQG
jgi:2-keto-4-pentenoate hydratase/2-oxohepta-3-ene-1,7-dioic acid hydratase in catechol pathway